jgi:hypothetical protein
MTTVDQLVERAKERSYGERLELTNRVLALEEAELRPDAEAIGDAEIAERIARFDRGETRTRPAAQVFADLDGRLNR